MAQNTPYDPYGKGDATTRLGPDAAGLRAAAALLSAGRLVALPTETVYGLGADARQGDAVARIYEAKGRPRFNPLIVHVADLAAARALADLPPELAALAEAFWPGPLTLVAPLSAGSGLTDLVTAGLPTVALRVPAHPAAQALLSEFGGPVAAPSANPSGRISPTTADHVLAGLGGRIAAVVDGGPCAVGLESTIVGMGSAGLVMLRPGGLALEEIARVAGPLGRAEPNDGITAPGQLASHYAPDAALRLDADAPAPGEVFLGFGPMPPGAEGLTLSETGDLRAAAAALFGHLHALDEMVSGRPGARIAVASVPMAGLGAAINDRLRRAARR